MEGRELYRLNDASRITGLSRSKFYDLAKRGEVQFVRLAGRTLLPKAEIERLIASAAPWAPNNTATAAANAARRKSAAPLQKGAAQ